MNFLIFGRGVFVKLEYIHIWLHCHFVFWWRIAIALMFWLVLLMFFSNFFSNRKYTEYTNTKRKTEKNKKSRSTGRYRNWVKSTFMQYAVNCKLNKYLILSDFTVASFKLIINLHIKNQIWKLIVCINICELAIIWAITMVNIVSFCFNRIFVVFLRFN